MSFTDLITSRFTFGPRFGDPSPLTSGNMQSWLMAQLSAPATDDSTVLTRLQQVQLPITIEASNGTSVTQNRALDYLFKTADELVAIGQADTSANKAESQRPADEVSAARWIRAAFSPWQIQEVMVDFWHNHFSVNAYQTTQMALMWPIYDTDIRANALGNFRALLGATAKSASMMYYLNQNASVAAHPNENYAREVMECHTLSALRYLGETTPAGTGFGAGYSDQDVTQAARILSGWTTGDGTNKAWDGSKPVTGLFVFNPSAHDTGSKVLFGNPWPAGGEEEEGEEFLDELAYHPGTAQTIAAKLYTRFVQDTPAAGDTLIAELAKVYRENHEAPNQIALMLATIIASPEFAVSSGNKVKAPFEFMISAIRATGAEINPQPALGNALATMGAPLFKWPAPNGMPDIGTVWTGTNVMVRRWALADQLMSESAGLVLDGPSTLFSATAPAVSSPQEAALAISQSVLGATVSASSAAALSSYAASHEVLGAAGAISNATSLIAGLRRLAGAAAATPEFQLR
jgi:uncharacterized protein (DUF1800 family)